MFPNFVNEPKFPECIVRPGERYSTSAVWKFSVEAWLRWQSRYGGSRGSEWLIDWIKKRLHCCNKGYKRSLALELVNELSCKVAQIYLYSPGPRHLSLDYLALALRLRTIPTFFIIPIILRLLRLTQFESDCKLLRLNCQKCPKTIIFKVVNLGTPSSRCSRCSGGHRVHTAAVCYITGIFSMNRCSLRFELSQKPSSCDRRCTRSKASSVPGFGALASTCSRTFPAVMKTRPCHLGGLLLEGGPTGTSVCGVLLVLSASAWRSRSRPIPKGTLLAFRSRPLSIICKAQSTQSNEDRVCRHLFGCFCKLLCRQVGSVLHILRICRISLYKSDKRYKRLYGAAREYRELGHYTYHLFWDSVHSSQVLRILRTDQTS